MIYLTYNDIADPVVLEDAIENNEYVGFKEDYHVLHCLMRAYLPKRVLEIGTNMGRGTLIIKNAITEGEVFSLDLPSELAHISLQSLVHDGRGDKVGSECYLPFTQLRGDSMVFDYTSLYPIDAWYIDGEHNYNNPYHESCEAIKSGAELIVWHDSDIECVFNAITDAFKGNTDYELFRVTDTRIMYAVKQ